ncbi:MAG: carboxypeptidase regulatory-like domain-containing protein, partial [Candidatus Spechtbacterales bacterium]|nr:carboxypeptidase regulatory-like domain-containing protein [Candidatus Spechtbacterales bacterium]
MKNFISGFSALIFILSSVIVPSASLAQTVSGVEFTNVRAESITASSADILWNTNIEVDTHKVEYGKTSGTYSSIVYSDQNPCLSRITTTSHCISLANLDPSTVYYYRVSVVESGGGGEHISGEYSFATTSTTSSSDNTTGSTPAAPTNLTATITSSGSSSSNIGLTWRDKSDNEEKFIIYRALTGNTLEHSIGHVGTNVTSYTDENGVLGTSYDYAVKACNSNYGCSEFSNMVTILYEDTTTDDITTTEEPASTVARVKGYILDPDGNPFTEGSVGIVFIDGNSTPFDADVDVATGYFYRDLEISKSYKPYIHVPQDLGYRTPDLSTFTLDDSGKDLGKIKLIKHDSTIFGTVKDQFGNPLSGIKIGASEVNTNNSPVTSETETTGQYTLHVSEGTWEVFVSTSNDGYAPVEPQEVSISSGTLIPSINFELNKVTSTLSGHLVNKNGNKVTSVSGRAGLFADDGTMKGGGPIENGEFSFAA